MIRALAILALSAITALAAPVRIMWPVEPAQVNVGFRVVKWSGATPITLGETTETSLTVDVKPGDLVSVIAFSPYFEDALPSPPYEIPPFPEKPKMVKVHLYRVTDLKRREILATYYLPKEVADNVQLGIETP